MTAPDTPAWWAWDDGSARITVRVVPGARKTAVAETDGAALRLRIAAPPVEGKANDEVCAFLARILGVRASAAEVSRGQKSRDKSVTVAGVEQSAWKAIVPEGEQ